MQSGRGSVSSGKVRHPACFCHLRHGVQARPDGACPLGRKAQAVHARVDFQENGVRLQGFVGGKHGKLLVAMHGVPHVQARAQLQITRFKHAFQ